MLGQQALQLGDEHAGKIGANLVGGPPAQAPPAASATQTPGQGSMLQSKPQNGPWSGVRGLLDNGSPEYINPDAVTTHNVLVGTGHGGSGLWEEAHLGKYEDGPGSRPGLRPSRPQYKTGGGKGSKKKG